MGWQRRRRHRLGPFFINTSRFLPTSWGIHDGRETYNVTRRRSTFRLPFGLGSWVSSRRQRRR